MESLIGKVKKLKGASVSNVVETRMKEFMYKRGDESKVFGELCFCLLTANFQAEKSIKIQEELEKDFVEASEEELRIKLKFMGHRFWPQRAERIVLARENANELFGMLDRGEFEIRDWLVRNIKGLGMKEASHFLRNIGFSDVAIIDFHIVDLLVREGMIERPKSLNAKIYLEIESALRDFGKEVDLNLAELDLYLWYIETGTVLK